MESNPNAGESVTRNAPLRDLLAMLHLFPAAADGHIDVAAVDPQLLLTLASRLDLTLGSLLQGIAGIGALLASVPMEETGEAVEIRRTIPSVGALLADLGEVLIYAYELSLACQPNLADYAP
ncbi:hypothetical protein IAG32_05610 [Achromobacter xylosoxidans]|uniref:Uncharacterized protein n=2 Tax=Alcaligenes xylosoxydans xylosoxydans TaxID=85698 RepID=A0A424WIK9_ALCXX|nr:hypothetical protein [Achromobacter xylosoxidans]MBC9903679.1 hypothetical protein [Achromobacter xylosoxidans]MBD0866863.1 hypothetical protein [Achromobacter xylosoxidans]QNP84782.1 hypothetical protein IAG39_25140 [Achromobacter xylosoxidans]RPJ93095.1 hypothetical protein DY367_04070 [Achromobacter xylosoxidans]